MKFSIGKGNGDLRRRMEEKRRAKQRSPGVTKRAKGGRNGKIGLGVFLSLFLFVGLGFGYFFFGRPVFQVWDAQDWPGVPARVTSSQVAENYDSEGSTYKIEITFSYEYQGRRYTGDMYDFFSFMSSSGHDGKLDVVRQYPVGKQTTAYVNPNDPSVAVLSRGWSHNLWFAVIPMVFVLIGGGGLLAMFRSGSRGGGVTKSAKRSDQVGPRGGEDWLPELVKRSLRDRGVGGGVRNDDAEAVSPTKSRLGTLAFVLVFALIWNGVTFAVLMSVFNGNQGWGVGLIMIPFVLVGLGLLISMVYMVLALSNPKVKMRFDPRVVPLGSTLRVDWSIDGRAERFQRLMITVEGLERASYTRGTDTITDEHVFFEHTLYDAEALDRRDPMAREGEAEMHLPGNVMHSLDASHNKIVWRVKVKGDIPKWPDVNDEYEFAVVPSTMAAGRRGMF